MSNKNSSYKFAQIIPTGTISIICGIGAISILFRYPIVAFPMGAIGSILGINTLKMSVEKLDKVFALVGIILSVGSMIYAITVFIQ